MPEERFGSETAACGARIVKEVPLGFVAGEPFARPSVMKDRTMPFAVLGDWQSRDQKTVQAVPIENALKYFECAIRRGGIVDRLYRSEKLPNGRVVHR